MRTLIVGGGALGSLFAAYLARDGQPVTLVARGLRADAVERSGVRIVGLETFTVPVAIARSVLEVDEADLVIVATKTYDTRTALEGLRLKTRPLAFSVQNGVQKNEELRAVFGPDRVLGAAATISSEVLPDHSTSFTLHDSLQIGEPDGSGSSRCSEVVKALAKSGLRARQVGNVSSVEWSKYALFTALMVPAILTRAPTWRIAGDPEAAQVVARIVREIGVLAERLGVHLNDDGAVAVARMCQGTLADAVAEVQKFGERLRVNAPNHRISTLQDLDRGRPLENEAILGYAVRKAREIGLALPVTEYGYQLSRILGQAKTG
jgi:2-dehydropantoate 2-reductase